MTDPTDSKTTSPTDAVPQRRRVVSFRLVAGILIAAAVVLNVTVPTMKVTFRKERVEPRLALKTLPLNLGPWKQISVDEALNHDTEQALAATEYVFRTYVDTSKLTPAQVAEFDKTDATGQPVYTAQQRLGIARKYAQADPSSSISFALTYYTGSVDTVAHIPDRCYIAGGYTVTSYETNRWPILPEKTGRTDRTAEVRYLTFENQVDADRSEARNVAYFFNVNGTYESDPINGVRKRLQNLLEKYGYYAKVELMTETNDTTVSKRAMENFLVYAMPEVEKILPDWDQVKRQN